MMRVVLSGLGWAASLAGFAYAGVQWFSPPLTGFDASAWVYNPQHVSAEIGAWDLKGCHIAKGVAKGSAREGGVWWEVPVYIIPHSTAPTSKEGWHTLGRWQWDRPENPADIDRVSAVVTAICGDQQTSITVGPIEVKDSR